MIVLPPNTIQNGGDGVALYHSSTHTYKAGMVVTEEGLVDAIVSTARESEKADKLLMVLTPGQSILYEDDSHSSQDESLSRCHGLKPRNQSSFQVTTITPLKENACLPPGASTSPPTPSTLVINELGLTNSTILYQFIELKGKPGTSLAGYILAFFSGQDSKAYASIPLRGTFGNEGLFVIAPEGQSRSDQLLPPLKDASSVRQGSSAVAVYHSPAAGIPIGSIATGENLVDAMAYTWESNTSRSQLDLFGPVRFMSSSWERPLSLSRCSCCNVTAALMYAISDPTPGLENSCPLKSFSVDLDMCLQTPNCSLWTQATVRMLDSLARALAKSMEESCSCGVSQCYLQGLHFTCVNSTLKLSGQVWARSQEQLHLITMWQRDFSTSPHPFPVEGRVLKTNTPCVNTESKTQSNSSFQAWGISLIVGSILFLLVLTGLALYYIKRRPQNYTTIEMNDRREIAADF
uniref:LTD domain-containing protein n=2 Tax=Sphenodon punctatus TaxID=8508 RepID=A0A8D0HLD4_SPHPU